MSAVSRSSASRDVAPDAGARLLWDVPPLGVQQPGGDGWSGRAAGPPVLLRARRERVAAAVAAGPAIVSAAGGAAPLGAQPARDERVDGAEPRPPFLPHGAQGVGRGVAGAGSFHAAGHRSRKAEFGAREGYKG